MTVVVDTGVLVALIDPDTREHAWAREEAARLPVPFLTSEARSEERRVGKECRSRWSPYH